MNNVKQVVMWEPKRAEKRKPDGSIIPGEYVGKFRTKVQQGTPGAIRHTGKNAAGKSWDYWGLDVDSINGAVRWIDVRTTDYGPKIVLFLETDKRLNQITMDYDVRNIHDVMNHLITLKKDLATAHINISYWVRKKTDKDKNVKVGNDGKPIWQKNLSFRDVPEAYNFEAWKKYSEENGLDWFQEERKGKKEWNFEAELNFWMSKVVAVQRFLLTTDTVLPFCWNSVTACENGLLTADEIATINSIYEAVKPLYRFPFSRIETTSDDVELAPPAGYDATNAAHAANPFDTGGDDFPKEEVGRDYEKTAQPGDVIPTGGFIPKPEELEDIPF